MPATNAFPLADADLCVKCALCLPHCPTYRLTLNEGDSPRGRIALMQGLATGAVPATGRLEQHLDGCLACRACEVVCPAEVPYGRLIDAGRALLAREGSSSRPGIRLTAGVLARPWIRRGLARLLWLYRACGLQALLRGLHLLGSGRLARLESLLPRLSWPVRFSGHYPATGARQGSVILFTGCSTELGEAQVLRDAITLLTRLGYEVSVPRAQGCCGALYQHNGMPDTARELARRNCAALAGAQPVLGTSSGCLATLGEYDELLPERAGESVAVRAQDVCAFLSDAKGWENLSVRPLTATVAVHEPCTLRNVLRRKDAAYRLLERIPQLRLLPLAGNDVCCGAAGSYFITAPEMADRLLREKLAALETAQPDFVATSNIGCALHIGASLRREGRALPLVHPVSLLVQQLVTRPSGVPSRRWRDSRRS